MDYAFPTYTKFEFCITDPCFRGKTILLDYWCGRSALLPAGRAASCFQMARPPAGHGEGDRQGRQRGSAHARTARVFAIAFGVTIPSPLLHLPIISSNQ